MSFRLLVKLVVLLEDRIWKCSVGSFGLLMPVLEIFPKGANCAIEFESRGSSCSHEAFGVRIISYTGGRRRD